MVSPPQTHPRCVRSLRTLLLSGRLLVSAGLMASQAAVTSAITGDGTLGTTVTRNGTLYAITGGTRPANGPNLFHSFDRFSIGTGDTASFSGPTGIAKSSAGSPGGSRRLLTGSYARRSPGPICICSIRVGCCLAPMPVSMSVGPFT